MPFRNLDPLPTAKVFPAWNGPVSQPGLLMLGLLFSISTSHLQAQPGDPINILNADELEYIELNGVRIRKLTGNVQLQQKDATLYCDQANYLLDESLVDATGNVRIRQGDSINITGQSLHYDGKLKQADLKGQVRLTDTHATLTTDVLHYDLNTRTASYVSGGQMISDESVLTSQRGYYYSGSADVYFRKEVKLHHPDYVLTTDTLRYNSRSRIAYFVAPTRIVTDSFDVYCEGGYYNTLRDIAQFEKNALLTNPPQSLAADTIYYERLKGFGVARSNIRWSDTASKIFLRGHLAELFETDERIVATKNAMLITMLGSDSMFLAGDTLLAYTDADSAGEFRRLLAFHGVRIFKTDLQGICDSAAFSFRDSIFRLYRNPVLWVDENQLKSDTIHVILKNGGIDRMDLLLNAFAASEAAPGFYNQVKGKNMYAYFIEGVIDRMEVIGNGESIYYAEGEDGGFIGVNKAECSNMVMRFDTSRKVNEIYFITQPDAVLYPLSQFPAGESRLRNFKWLEAERPRDKESLTQTAPAYRPER